MLVMKYVGLKTEYLVEFRRISSNIVEVKGVNLPEKSNGFTLSRIGVEDQWDYSNYKTVYRKADGKLQFSDDGSVWLPRVSFKAGNGGILEGKTIQSVCRYENLTIPACIADEDYEFAGWQPEIPEAGEIKSSSVSFTALFRSTLPPAPSEPTELDILGERIDSMELAIIENYEAQETINQDVETALIDIYETIGGQ